MKKSMDLMNEKRYKKIFLSNDLEDFDDNQNHDNNKLTHKYTIENMVNKKNLSFNNNEVNPSTIINNKNSNEIFPEKNDFISERKTINIIGKNNKDNKKKVYIKKKKLEKANKNKNNENKSVVKSPTKEDKDIDNDFEQKEIIKEIKDSVICYICLMKITSPRICPNCHKIACEKCLRNWFIEKGNNNCGYCRSILSFDKMISIPIINDVANLIDKISSKNSNKKLGIKYTKSKNVKKNYKSISDISNELNNNNNLTDLINNDNITRNSINIDNFSKLQKNNNEIYINKNQPLVSQSTHGPFVNMMENEYNNSNEEYCPKHPDQPLFYYCVNCNLAYCRTCFVFFGEEKDKHNNHTIIEYEKYKLINIGKIKKLSSTLDDKYEELDAYIKRCEALKNCYEFERKLVQKHVKELMDNFDSKINENIQILDNIIKKYNFYLNQIEKGQNDIDKLYTKISSSQLKLYEEDLIEKLTNICKINYYNSKEVDAFSDINKKIFFNFYQTKLKKYEIKQNNYHFKIPLDNSKYQLAITEKGSEVQIYIYWPLDDINKKENEKKNILPLIFLRRKNRNWEHFQLDEFLTYKGNNYFIKRFPVNNFCNINSYFKIKGLLYESCIE